MHISERLREQARPRLERIAEAVRQGVPRAQIARQEGVSRQRVYMLIAKAKREGML